MRAMGKVVPAAERALYSPPSDPVLIEVPAFEFVMVDGQGDPQRAESYRQAISVLYSVSYPVVMTLKKQGRPELKVRPLEGLWWAPDLSSFDPMTQDRDAWRWTAMIRQPDLVPAHLYEQAREKAGEKLGDELVSRLRVERLEEGLCAQLMHHGPYADETDDIVRLHEFVAAAGLHLRGRHHEIYLSDPRRCAPEKLRTVIRHPVSR